MNQLVDKWIFEDNYIAIDKVQFENYLRSENIIVQSYLKEIMDDGESDVWRYPAYASAQEKSVIHQK